MVQALAPDATQEPLAGGIRSQRPDRRAQDSDPAARRDAGERGAVLAVVVTYVVLRALPEGRRLARLRRDPSGGRVPRDADVDDPARPEFDGAAGVERAEEQVGDRQEVAGLDLACLVAQERRPGLPASPNRAALARISLESRLGHADVEA